MWQLSVDSKDKETKQPPLKTLIPTNDNNVVSKAGLHSTPTYKMGDEVLIGCNSKISLNFCKDCRIFCEVEWDIKVNAEVTVDG